MGKMIVDMSESSTLIKFYVESYVEGSPDWNWVRVQDWHETVSGAVDAIQKLMTQDSVSGRHIKYRIVQEIVISLVLPTH